MRFLDTERETLRALLPGLDDALAAQPLAAREEPGSGVIGLFRDAGGAGLLVPRVFSGVGATALEGVRVQRAVGSRSPSLAIATTMHHFSTATLVHLTDGGAGMEGLLLEAIAADGRLVASGFAEGRAGQGVLTPALRARRVGDRVVVSGVKKPCSLSRSMDLLTASAVVVEEDGSEDLVILVIPSTAPGLQVRPFWAAPVLTAAESDEVVLTDVAIEPDLVVSLGDAGGERLDGLQAVGFLWFELFMTASYLGIASALVERVLEESRGDAMARLPLVVELEAAVAGLEGVAAAFDGGVEAEQLVTRALFVRYAAQDAITRVVAGAVELLGGLSFITDPDVAYLAGASRALAFHPPARHRAAESLVAALKGEPFAIQ